MPCTFLLSAARSRSVERGTGARMADGEAQRGDGVIPSARCHKSWNGVRP
jgi:hypothetical protein